MVEFVQAMDFCTSVRDGTHDTPKPTYSGYKLVTGKHIKNGQIDPSDAYFISEEDYNKINERSLVEKWDVLMSMIGTVGEVAVVKDVPDYAIKNVALFKCGGSDLKGRWLSYYLRTPFAKGHMSGNQKGSSQQFLSLKQLRELPVPVVEERKMLRIIDILSAYDDLIENNQKQIKLLEEAAQRLYKEWFIDLRFPGHESTPIHDGIPEGWREKPIGKQFVTVLGGTPSRANSSYWNGTTNWINSGEINNLRIIKASELITSQAVKESATKMMPKHTTVLAITGATLGQVSYTEIETCANQSVVGIIDESQFYSAYIYLYVSDRITHMIGKATGGAQQHINKDIVNAYPIVLPSEDIVKRLNQVVIPIFDKIASLLFQNQKLAEARDRLLPKLMSGEIEV